MMTLAWILVAESSAGPVQLKTGDGVALGAQSWGTGTRGVLLVPDESGDHAAWSFVGERMARGGLQVLAIDLRSKGATLAESDWPKLTADVDAGVAWLLSHGSSEIHVVGSGFGANLALQAAGANPEIDALVVLSPTMASHGLKVSTSLPLLGERPLLIETSNADPLAARAANWMNQQATGPHELHVRPVGGTGVGMFNTVPDLESTVVGWVNSVLAKMAQDARAAKASELGNIETTGTRLEDRDN